MCGRVAACNGGISAAPDHAAVEHDYRADRDLPPAFGFQRKFQRLSKKILVCQVLDRYAFDNALQRRRGDDAFQPETGSGE